MHLASPTLPLAPPAYAVVATCLHRQDQLHHSKLIVHEQYSKDNSPRPFLKCGFEPLDASFVLPLYLVDIWFHFGAELQVLDGVGVEKRGRKHQIPGKGSPQHFERLSAKFCKQNAQSYGHLVWAILVPKRRFKKMW